MKLIFFVMVTISLMYTVIFVTIQYIPITANVSIRLTTALLYDSEFYDVAMAEDYTR